MGSSRRILRPPNLPPPATAPATPKLPATPRHLARPLAGDPGGCFGTEHAGPCQQGTQTSGKAADSVKCKKLSTFLAAPLCGIWSMLQKVAARGDKDRTRLISPGNWAWKERENEPHSKGASSTTPLPCKLDIWMSHLPSAGKFPDLSLRKQEALNI